MRTRAIFSVIFSVISPVLLLAPLAAMSAEPLTARFSTTGVTVYTDRALVTVQAQVNLKAGLNSIRFADLPGDLREDSVACSAPGPGLTIRAIELARQFHPQALNAELRRLQSEQEILTDRETQLNYDRKAEEARIKTLDSMEAAQGRKISPESLENSNLTKLDQNLEFLTRKRKEAYAGLLQNDLRLRTLRTEKKILEENLSRLKSGQETRTRTLVATVEAAQAGPRDITVRYVIPRARWRPSYDLRADEDLKTLELTYYGTVSQESGEDWRDIQLFLSTARPGLGAAPPPMRPVILTPGQVASSLSSGGDQSDDGKFGRTERETTITTGAPPAPTVLYAVGGRQSIASGDRPRRIPVSVDRFPMDVTYVCQPRDRSSAFLLASVQNASPRLLLPGPMSIFLGGDFVGSSELDGVAPGQPFTAFLGVDERFKVSRRPVMDRSQSAFWGDSLVLSQGFQIKVENFSGHTRRVRVQDQIPVSRDASIKVRAFQAEGDAKLAEESGEVTWEFDLKEGASRVVGFQYEVVFPPEVHKAPGARRALDEMRARW